MAPTSGWLGPFTGEGITDINGGAAVTPSGLDVSVDSITSPQVRVLGTIRPHRLQYAGSFGLSFTEDDAGGTSRDFVLIERVIDFEFMDISLVEFAFFGNQAQRLWWRLRPGVTAHFGVYY